MSLDKKKEFPPQALVAKPKQKKGPRTPKPIQVKRRVMGKWKTHPVDKMVKIANFIEATNPEFAAKIWMRLLDSCEMEENKKKSSMPPPIAGNETASEADALKLLEEMEQDDETAARSDQTSVAPRKTEIQTETVSEEDL